MSKKCVLLIWYFWTQFDNLWCRNVNSWEFRLVFMKNFNDLHFFLEWLVFKDESDITPSGWNLRWKKKRLLESFRAEYMTRCSMWTSARLWIKLAWQVKYSVQVLFLFNFYIRGFDAYQIYETQLLVMLSNQRENKWMSLISLLWLFKKL